MTCKSQSSVCSVRVFLVTLGNRRAIGLNVEHERMFLVGPLCAERIKWETKTIAPSGFAFFFRSIHRRCMAPSFRAKGREWARELARFLHDRAQECCLHTHTHDMHTKSFLNKFPQELTVVVHSYLLVKLKTDFLYEGSPICAVFIWFSVS